MVAYATYAAKAGDRITITYTRDGSSYITSGYTVQSGDIQNVW